LGPGLAMDRLGAGDEAGAGGRVEQKGEDEAYEIGTGFFAYTFGSGSHDGDWNVEPNSWLNFA